MIENNYYSENPDIQEHFEKIIDWNEIVEAYEQGYTDAKEYAETQNENLAYAPNNVEEALDYYRSILESVGELSGKSIAPIAQEIDAIGLKFENGKVTFPEAMSKVYFQFKEAGLMPYSLSREYGGLGLPATAVSFILEMVTRADTSTGLAVGATNIGECLEHFASEEIKTEYVSKLGSGEYTSAMALTEPNYGSDLQNLQTRAVKDEDGTWRLTGTKRFITHGCGFDDVPSLILTLARTGGKDSGARGLSFFIVDSNDVEIAGVEHKLGLHCSATCEVVYDNSKGVLIGKEGEGLIKGAMGMMNSARLSVAAQGLGVATAAHEEAKKYAGERVQFGKLIQELPPVKKMLDRMEREVSAMRCVLTEASRSVDMYVWRKHALAKQGMSDRDIRKDEQVKTWEKMANLFTPLSRYYCTEMSNVIAYDAVQVHGGAGFTEEYDVARLYRDARIGTIYEGTTQLQTLAIIGGFTAGMSANGNVRQYIEENLSKFSASPELKELLTNFDNICAVYKEISDKEMKETRAFEVVECGARFMNGLLLERAASRLDGEAKERRLKLAQDYHLDSAAILASNMVKLKAATKQPAMA